jgi:hypothetical protein
MPKSHKGLPADSQAWANDVDALLEENKHLKEVLRQLCANAGIDYSNPKRGVNTGDTPSVDSAVKQKLSSLADVQTYNIADKQVLTWSQSDQKWLPVTPAAGETWHLATEEEHLWGDLDSDSDYYSTQVSGLYANSVPDADPADDGYGLVGTSTSSAFLHGSQRWFGGPTKAHGYVYAGPYYTKMGVVWIDDTGGKNGQGGWDRWGEVGVDREDVWISTPIGQPSTHASVPDGTLQRDGAIILRTNWFYVPQVNGMLNPAFNIKYPRRPVPLAGQAPEAGAMVYDMNLRQHIQWNGAAWVDMLGNAIPAADY